MIPATLVTPGGEGPQSLTCLSPVFTEEQCRTVQVYVTNNNDNPSGGTSLTSAADYAGYTFYESNSGVDNGLSTPGGATLRSPPGGWTGGDTS